jgi:DNA-binding transcriptional MerR regulator/uncharacterized glyoxalase superfamily protein PhnB
MIDEAWKIGPAARATGLSVRTLRYYDELGLVCPSRLEGGHRLYDRHDIERLYRVCVMRSLGRPLVDIKGQLATETDLSQTVAQHLIELDERLAAIGRERERVMAAQSSLASGRPSDRQLFDLLRGVRDTDFGLLQRIPILVYADVERAQDWLVAVFGFSSAMAQRDASGHVIHAELFAGDGPIWLHREASEFGLAAPDSLGASTHTMSVMVEDVDSHHAQAAAAGALIVAPPRNEPYGYREYDVRDCEGGLWSFMSPITEEDE